MGKLLAQSSVELSFSPCILDVQWRHTPNLLLPNSCGTSGLYGAKVEQLADLSCWLVLHVQSLLRGLQHCHVGWHSSMWLIVGMCSRLGWLQQPLHQIQVLLERSKIPSRRSSET